MFSVRPLTRECDGEISQFAALVRNEVHSHIPSKGSPIGDGGDDVVELADAFGISQSRVPEPRKNRRPSGKRFCWLFPNKFLPW